MDSLIAAAARALAAGDTLGALKHVGLRDDPPALALRGIAMAQLGEHPRARELLRLAARGFGAHEEVARARCVVAEAEVALAMRDLRGSPRTLAAASATLEARADRANALHARLIAVRRLLLLGRLDEAASALGRLGNLAGLRVDRHIEVHGESVVLRLSGAETKNGQLLECWLPRGLVEALDRYLREVRPRFYRADQHQGLWPSSKGRPLTTGGVYQIVIRRTKAAFGHAVNPHVVRDAAATTLALARPDQALLAPDLLGHTRLDTTERHYLHAKTAEAGRAYAGRIAGLRRAPKTARGLQTTVPPKTSDSCVGAKPDVRQ